VFGPAEQPGGVANREDEAVAIGPDGFLRVEAQDLLPQAMSTGATAMGVPGWPELAACTASIASVRIVLMLVNSIGERTGTSRFTIVALIRSPLLLIYWASATP
jgi:hypothetical protein